MNPRFPSSGGFPSAEFVMLREGIQECEARIFLEKALADPNALSIFGRETLQQWQALLDERTRYAMWVFDSSYLNYNIGGTMLGRPMDLGWFSVTRWQERAKHLYTAAAEAAARLTGTDSSPRAQQTGE